MGLCPDSAYCEPSGLWPLPTCLSYLFVQWGQECFLHCGAVLQVKLLSRSVWPKVNAC